MSTRVTLRDARAIVLYEEIKARPELVDVIDDVVKLPRCGKWPPRAIALAVDDLVAEGVLTEAADGRLCVLPWGGTR